MRRASVSQFSTVMLLLPTRMTSSTSSRAIFLRAGIASATSPAWRRPDGVLAMVPPVATTLTSGSLSWACAALTPAGPTHRASISAAARRTLPPGAIVDRVLVGGAGRNELPAERPLIGVLEALARVGLGRRVQDAREVEVLQLEQPARLLDEVVRVALGGLLDRPCRLGFRLEHLLQRRAVELVARGFAARRVRLHEHPQPAL